MRLFPPQCLVRTELDKTSTRPRCLFEAGLAGWLAGFAPVISRLVRHTTTNLQISGNEIGQNSQDILVDIERLKKRRKRKLSHPFPSELFHHWPESGAHPETRSVSPGHTPTPCWRSFGSDVAGRRSRTIQSAPHVDRIVGKLIFELSSVLVGDSGPRGCGFPLLSATPPLYSTTHTSTQKISRDSLRLTTRHGQILAGCNGCASNHHRQ